MAGEGGEGRGERREGAVELRTGLNLKAVSVEAQREGSVDGKKAVIC